jgi:hypothetical protein
MTWSRRALCVLIFPMLMTATDLRGRVVRAAPYQAPAPGVRIMLQSPSGQPASAAVYSGGDGFFYLYNVRPGSYRMIYVFVNRRTGQQAQGAAAVVVGNAKNQDIAQITLND